MSTVYVIRHRVTNEGDWEKNMRESSNRCGSYGRWYLMLDGVATTFEGGAMIATAHYLQDATKDKVITWETKHGEMYGVIKDGGYVSEYLIEARTILSIPKCADILNYQRTDFNRRNAS